jgi:AraC family transcriptional activator of pobA
MTDTDPSGDPPPTAVARTLYDRRDGRLALEVADPPAADLTRPHRTNYFTAYWVRAGRGAFRADDARHPFAAPCVLFLTPYQAARLEPDGDLRVTAVRFHANFLCVETHHHEVGCNGVLFNDPYGVPAVALDEPAEREVGDLVARMRDELTASGLAQAEMLLSYLKILLVRATRLKREQQGSACGTPRPTTPGCCT